MVAASSSVRQAGHLPATATLAEPQGETAAMGFNPGTGMTPNDWSEQEARRAERVQRADNPHGREMSSRSRRISGWILGLAALALIVYAIFAWASIIG